MSDVVNGDRFGVRFGACFISVLVITMDRNETRTIRDI